MRKPEVELTQRFYGAVLMPVLSPSGSGRTTRNLLIGRAMSEPVYPAPPNKPQPYECCERGCCPCIFDYYWDALARWEETIREMGGEPAAVLEGMGRAR